MSKGFRLDPIRRLWSSRGSLFPQGEKGDEFELQIPSDYATVPYHLVIDQATGLPAWAPFFTETFVVIGPTIASGSQLYPPTVRVPIGAGNIPSGSQLYPPTLAQSIVGGTIGPTSVLYAPTLSGEQTIVGGTIGPTATLYAPSLAQALSEPWGEVGRQESIVGGELTLSGLDLSLVKAIEFHITGVTVTTDDSTVDIRFIVGGVEISSGYRWAHSVRDSIAGVENAGSTSATEIPLTDTRATHKVGNASSEGLDAVVTIYSPTSASMYKRAFLRSSYLTPAGNVAGMDIGGGQLNNTGAITGIKVRGSSNLTGGTIVALGVA